MNKRDLITTLAGTCGLSLSQAETLINAFLKAITGAIAQGEAITLIGFGTFSVKTRAARIGRNPQSGEPLQIPETKVVTFKPGNKLKDAINASF